MDRGIRLLAGFVAGLVVGGALAPGAQAQGCGVEGNVDPCTMGQWAGPWDWTVQVGGAPICDKFDEFSHANLLPVGTHAGKVLLWRKDVNPNNCNASVTTESWLFDPSNPDTLIQVQHPPLDSDVFCAGQAWDSNGFLVVAGGVNTGTGFPADTYRFNPRALSLVAYAPAVPPAVGYPYTSAANCWVKITGDLNMPRYYPTVLQLNDSIVTGGACTPAAGSMQVVLGGPRLPNLQTQIGNEVWSFLEVGADAWGCPVISERMTTNSPNWPENPNAWPVTEKYFMLPTSPSNQFDLLDSYPRAFQLSNGQVFIAGDIDTNGNPPPAGNVPGTSWVIDAPSPGGTWKLRDGRNSDDRYYGGAVLHHDLALKDRVLVFGGADLGKSKVHDSVQETSFQGGLAQDGIWRTKKALINKRVFCTAVTLPTGDILVVNGTKDYFNPIPNGVFQPELYSPGPGPGTLGSRTALAPSNQADRLTGNGQASTPRGYHSFALLLQDGRVLIGGGERDTKNGTVWPYPESMYTGEVFSPPYLFEGSALTVQPTIESSPGRIDYGTQFTVEYTTFGGTIDRVVALRPAAMTHHVDANQRYIELAYTPGPGANELTVTAPALELAPKGHYMLFVVEHRTTPHDRRIPSVGKFVKFR